MAAFALKLEPADKIVFAGNTLGMEPNYVTLRLTNPKPERVAYKVKCTSNEMFRIRPPVGVIDGNGTVKITLVFRAGKTIPENGKHYFVVHCLKAVDDNKDGRETWAAKPEQPTTGPRLHVDFNKNGVAQKEEVDSKKDEKVDDKTDKKDGVKKEDDKKEGEKKEEKKEEKKTVEKKE